MYAVLLFAVDIHSIHVLHIAELAFHQFRIVVQFTVRQAVGGEYIEHAVHRREVLLGHRCIGTRRQLRLCVIYLSSQAVPTLLHLLIADGASKLHLYYGEVVIGITLDIVQVAHGAYALFEHIRNLHLHLMSRSSGIGGNHHGQLHFHLRVLELAHVIARVGSSHQEHSHQEIYQQPIVECPFTEVHYSSPPILVLETGAMRRTFWPSLRWCTPVETTRSPGLISPTTSTVPSV